MKAKKKGLVSSIIVMRPMIYYRDENGLVIFAVGLN